MNYLKTIFNPRRAFLKKFPAVVAGTQKSAAGTQEFLDNAGAHVECHVLDNVIIVPNSVYADEETNGGPEGNNFIDTAETPGSWLDQQVTAAAAAHRVPRENIVMVFYIKNQTDGGIAHTNYGGHGYTIKTEPALHPGRGWKKLQDEIGIHEMGKMITLTDSHTSWEVPINADGSLMYDFRSRDTDTVAPKKIETCGSPGGTLIRRIPDIMRNDADGNPHTYQLFDNLTQQWIEIPVGGGRFWHQTDWKWAIDKFTIPRIAIATPPEAHGESLDVQYLGTLAIADLIANDPRATDIQNPQRQPVTVHVADMAGHQITLPIDPRADGKISLAGLRPFAARPGAYVVSVKTGHKILRQ